MAQYVPESDSPFDIALDGWLNAGVDQHFTPGQADELASCARSIMTRPYYSDDERLEEFAKDMDRARREAFEQGGEHQLVVLSSRATERRRDVWTPLIEQLDGSITYAHRNLPPGEAKNRAIAYLEDTRSEVRRQRYEHGVRD